MSLNTIEIIITFSTLVARKRFQLLVRSFVFRKMEFLFESFRAYFANKRTLVCVDANVSE